MPGKWKAYKDWKPCNHEMMFSGRWYACFMPKGHSGDHLEMFMGSKCETVTVSWKPLKKKEGKSCRAGQSQP